MKTLEVTAAIIRQNGKVLICQRPVEKNCGLLWEFPGGKIEAGETGEQCIIRECQEELGVTVEVEDIFMELIHTYPDLTVHLTLFHAKIESGTPQLLEHNAIRWISTGQICQYDFCPADQGILQALQDGKK